MKRSGPAPPPRFIHCDNHILAADKPAGLPSQPDASGDASLIDLAKEHIRREFSKPGNVYLALLHRLDRPTSGIVLLARTDKAAGRMAELFRKREVDKTYLALVECHADPGGPGVWHPLRHRLLQAGNGNMKPAAGDAGRAKEARLSYRVAAVGAKSATALLQVRLETGVKHQIRCQLANAGLPVKGDFRYGPFGRPARPDPVDEGRAILLHSWRVGLVHPVRRERIALETPVPRHWNKYLDGFGGVAKIMAALAGRTTGDECVTH